MTSPGQNKTIVLVSSGQPTANPRLVKEAIAFANAGYQVTVMYCPLSPWADDYDVQLFQQYPEIKWMKVGAHPVHNKWLYRYDRLRQKLYNYFTKVFPDNALFAIRSMTLYSQELVKQAQKIKADFYIGHNLGALPAVVNAAKQNKAKAIFDFEDYHRGEDVEGSVHWNKVALIEDQYAPELLYATTASPLITQKYQLHYPQLKVYTINNCFPLSFGKNELSSLPILPLKLFWFSQFIGPKRGLETVIAAMGKVGNTNIQLALLGNISETDKNYFLQLANDNALQESQIVFLAPVAEHEIVSIASQHHIGLACEIPHIINREVCLTNKIFMYLVAGNAIIYSDTKAQTKFRETYPETGTVYAQNDNEGLAIIFKDYIEKPELLEQHRAASLRLAKETMNWEVEQKKLLELLRSEL